MSLIAVSLALVALRAIGEEPHIYGYLFYNHENDTVTGYETTDGNEEFPHYRISGEKNDKIKHDCVPEKQFRISAPCVYDFQCDSGNCSPFAKRCSAYSAEEEIRKHGPERKPKDACTPSRLSLACTCREDGTPDPEHWDQSQCNCTDTYMKRYNRGTWAHCSDYESSRVHGSYKDSMKPQMNAADLSRRSLQVVDDLSNLKTYVQKMTFDCNPKNSKYSTAGFPMVLEHIIIQSMPQVTKKPKVNIIEFDETAYEDLWNELGVVSVQIHFVYALIALETDFDKCIETAKSEVFNTILKSIDHLTYGFAIRATKYDFPTVKKLLVAEAQEYVGENCAPFCPVSNVANEECDYKCYNEACDWDGGDCGDEVPGCAEGCTPERKGNYYCDKECYNEQCQWDQGDCGSTVGCQHGCDPYVWLGNGECNWRCFNAGCGWDLGDCVEGGSTLLANGGMNCEDECLGFFGEKCQWCGTGKCCKANKLSLEEIEIPTKCSASEGGIETHTCVEVPKKGCADGCFPDSVGDLLCDLVCFNAACNWDGKDCGRNVGCAPGCVHQFVGDGVCDYACFVADCNWDVGDCGVKEGCEKSCLPEWLGNGICDPACVSDNCFWDRGDCGSMKRFYQRVRFMFDTWEDVNNMFLNNAVAFDKGAQEFIRSALFEGVAEVMGGDKKIILLEISIIGSSVRRTSSIVRTNTTSNSTSSDEDDSDDLGGERLLSELPSGDESDADADTDDGAYGGDIGDRGAALRGLASDYVFEVKYECTLLEYDFDNIFAFAQMDKSFGSYIVQAMVYSETQDIFNSFTNVEVSLDAPILNINEDVAVMYKGTRSYYFDANCTDSAGRTLEVNYSDDECNTEITLTQDGMEKYSYIKLSCLKNGFIQETEFKDGLCEEKKNVAFLPHDTCVEDRMEGRYTKFEWAETCLPRKEVDFRQLLEFIVEVEPHVEMYPWGKKEVVLEPIDFSTVAPAELEGGEGGGDEEGAGEVDVGGLAEFGEASEVGVEDTGDGAPTRIRTQESDETGTGEETPGGGGGGGGEGGANGVVKGGAGKDAAVDEEEVAAGVDDLAETGQQEVTRFAIDKKIKRAIEEQVIAKSLPRLDHIDYKVVDFEREAPTDYFPGRHHSYKFTVNYTINRAYVDVALEYCLGMDYRDRLEDEAHLVDSPDFHIRYVYTWPPVYGPGPLFNSSETVLEEEILKEEFVWDPILVIVFIGLTGVSWCSCVVWLFLLCKRVRKGDRELREQMEKYRKSVPSGGVRSRALILPQDFRASFANKPMSSSESMASSLASSRSTKVLSSVHRVTRPIMTIVESKLFKSSRSGGSNKNARRSIMDQIRGTTPPGLYGPARSSSIVSDSAGSKISSGGGSSAASGGRRGMLPSSIRLNIVTRGVVKMKYYWQNRKRVYILPSIRSKNGGRGRGGWKKYMTKYTPGRGQNGDGDGNDEEDEDEHGDGNDAGRGNRSTSNDAGRRAIEDEAPQPRSPEGAREFFGGEGRPMEPVKNASSS